MTLKNLRENAENISTKQIKDDNISQNAKNMNWENLIKGNFASLPEIRAKHEGKLELLKAIAKEISHNDLAIDKEVKLNDVHQQEKLIEIAFDKEMSKQLDKLHKHEETSQLFNNNQPEITEDLRAQQSLEREKLFRELLEAKERNRFKTLER